MGKDKALPGAYKLSPYAYASSATPPRPYTYQKAQWSREGTHNVLQIRTSRASKDWEEEWNYVTDRLYVPRYNKESKVAA